MDVFDTAQDMLGKGVSAMKGAVGGMAVEGQPFMKAFARMCSDGWERGWHEANGGNLTYRLTAAEAQACRPYLYDAPSSWVGMGIRDASLAGAYFATTRAGCHMRNVAGDIARNIGIVEISETGDSWRVVWGLADGGRPTSEFASHFLIHGVRAASLGDASRVLYHAHPDHVVALTKVLPPDARAVTRALWQAMTECVMLFPQGVGVVGCMVPGSLELARASAEVMRVHDAVIWAHHGLFCAGPDFDSAFGLAHAIEKAASIYALARTMNGGNDDFPYRISDDGLRAIADRLGLPINEAFLG